MDRKTIILIVALVAVVILYFPALQYFGLVEPPAPQPTTDSIQQPSSQTQSTGWETTQTAPLQQTSDTLATPVESATLVPPPVDSTLPADTVVIRTDKYTVALVTDGGGPVSLLLNEYGYRDKNPIQMLPDAQLATPEISFAGGTFSASRIHYQCNLQPGRYDAITSTQEVTYTFTQPDGGQITKRYLFGPDRYDYDFIFEVNETAKFGFERKYEIIWNTPLGVSEPDLNSDYEMMEAVAMQAGSRATLDDWDDGALNQVMTGTTEWAGVRAKYFAAVMIPRNRVGDAALATGIKREILTADDEIESRHIIAGLEMQFANAPVIADTFTVFVGPLDYTLMSDYEVGLEDILGIGTTPFIGWLIKPFAIAIIWVLPRMYDFIPNYGIVIILFAFLVKMVTLPLSLKSFKSMNAMKMLQPKVDELKKKHKKNPQALNKEMMKMYKAHGVNPMSGCLPILPQMPLFFALFSVFRSTILLRDAPFIFFIDDLSRGASSFTDPYIILVLIMIAAQFISQKFTMASATQQNKALMYIMPLFMGFIFYRFAAGLVLYWACFSLFSLVDYMIFRRDKAPEIKTA